MHLCLGTVQLGLDYGVLTTAKKPSFEESIGILEKAYSMGIRYFDTAFAYGNAEDILGAFIEKNDLSSKIQVITKLKPNILEEYQGDIRDIIRNNLLESLKRLKINKVNGYMLHSPKYVFNPEVLSALSGLKNEGLIEKIGVSIYEVDEALFAVESEVIDYIQIPYNVFDRRLEETDFFQKSKMNKKTIFARSAFLKGVLTLEQELVPDYFNEIKPDIERMDEIFRKNELNKSEGCISFVKNNPDIDYLVIGIDNVKQLSDNVSFFYKEHCSSALVDEIKDTVKIGKNHIIIPSLWSR